MAYIKRITYSVWTSIACVFTLIGIVLLNLDWFAFLKNKRGLGFSFGSFPLTIIYFTCAGLGYMYAWIEHKLVPQKDIRVPS